MSVSVSYSFTLYTTETLESGVPSVSSPVIRHDAYDETGLLNADSTPPATNIAAFLQALTAGAATIDLTALTGANGTIDGTGKRVQAIRVKNTGANAMTFSEGASNGIALACGTFIVPPGGVVQMLLNDAAPDIAAADRTIDIAGTAAQEAEVTIILG